MVANGTVDAGAIDKTVFDFLIKERATGCLQSPCFLSLEAVS
jgi:hypothetical protein